MDQKFVNGGPGSFSYLLGEFIGTIQQHYSRLASLPKDWQSQIESKAAAMGSSSKDIETLVNWTIRRFGMKHTTYLSAETVAKLEGKSAPLTPPQSIPMAVVDAFADVSFHIIESRLLSLDTRNKIKSLFEEQFGTTSSNINRDDFVAWIEQENGQIISALTLDERRNESNGLPIGTFIWNLCTSSDFRNMGFASSLLKYVQNWMNSTTKNSDWPLSLIVQIHNYSAVRLYEKNGFIFGWNKEARLLPHQSPEEQGVYLMHWKTPTFIPPLPPQPAAAVVNTGVIGESKTASYSNAERPLPLLGLLDNQNNIVLTLNHFLGVQMPFIYEWLADALNTQARLMSSSSLSSSLPPQGVILDLSENAGGSWIAMFSAVHWLCDKLVTPSSSVDDMHYDDVDNDDHFDPDQNDDIILCQAIRPGLKEKKSNVNNKKGATAPITVVSSASWNPTTHMLRETMQYKGTRKEVDIPAYTSAPLDHHVRFIKEDGFPESDLDGTDWWGVKLFSTALGIIQHEYAFDFHGDLDDDDDELTSDTALAISFADSSLHTAKCSTVMPLAIMTSRRTASAAEILIMLLRRFCSNVGDTLPLFSITPA